LGSESGLSVGSIARSEILGDLAARLEHSRVQSIPDRSLLGSELRPQSCRPLSADEDANGNAEHGTHEHSSDDDCCVHDQVLS
jgi:hypothetical protein